MKRDSVMLVVIIIAVALSAVAVLAQTLASSHGDRGFSTPIPPGQVNQTAP